MTTSTRQADRRLRGGARRAAPLALAIGLSVALVGQTGHERIFLGPDGEPLPIQDPEEIRHFLRTAEIVRIEELPSGTTNPRRVTLADGDIRARAVFRFVDERKEDLTMDNGRVFLEFFDRASSELAAYELARMLGIEMIPPTVERTVDGEDGTLQLWIEEAITETRRSRQEIRPQDYRAWRRQHAAMRFFDALVFNQDRNTGNRLIDADGNLWMIDHTRTFQRARGRHPFDPVVQVPGDVWERFLEIDERELRERLLPHLERLQLASLLDRWEAMEEHIRALIRERGREAVILPAEPIRQDVGLLEPGIGLP